MFELIDKRMSLFEEKRRIQRIKTLCFTVTISVILSLAAYLI
jgi:hypothetical protein